MTTQIHPLKLALNKAETDGALFFILSNLRSVKKEGKIPAARAGLGKTVAQART